MSLAFEKHPKLRQHKGGKWFKSRRFCLRIQPKIWKCCQRPVNVDFILKRYQYV